MSSLLPSKLYLRSPLGAKFEIAVWGILIVGCLILVYAAEMSNQSATESLRSVFPDGLPLRGAYVMLTLACGIGLDFKISWLLLVILSYIYLVILKALNIPEYSSLAVLDIVSWNSCLAAAGLLNYLSFLKRDITQLHITARQSLPVRLPWLEVFTADLAMEGQKLMKALQQIPLPDNDPSRSLVEKAREVGSDLKSFFLRFDDLVGIGTGNVKQDRVQLKQNRIGHIQFRRA